MGGSSIQFRTPNPAVWPRGSRRGGGGAGGFKIFFGLWGHFGIPCFILRILIIHKRGEIFFYRSSEMKNSRVLQ